MNKFYVFGLQRSGTNYLEQTLAKNFNLRRENPSNRNGERWKHRVSVSEQVKNDDIPIFVIHKNPYMWIESICFRKSFDWKETQTDFPATIPHANPEYNVGKENLNIVNLAKTYQMFYRNWVTRSDKELLDKVYKIKYEDMLDDDKRVEILKDIRDTYDFKHPDTMPWENPTRVGMSPLFTPQSKAMYVNQTPQHLTENQIKIITQTLSPMLISNLGYDIL